MTKFKDRYSDRVDSYRYEYEGHVVALTLMEYYDMCSKPDKIDNADEWIETDAELLKAIERVLQDFLPHYDFVDWLESRD
jgi:hypothetical protein